MLEYQIKFGLCLLLFYLFYRLLLERQSFHHFKRFYLLLSFIAAAIIPKISLPVIRDEHPAQAFNAQVFKTIEPLQIRELAGESDLTLKVLLIIYISGVVILTIRFLVNLSHLVLAILKSPKAKAPGAVRVLMEENIIPHTFLRFVFVNRDLYFQNDIPEEVLKHEETHARQWHSLDILAIEMLSILLWFNPMVYLFKKAIQLNHEFLADSAVLKNGVPRMQYWETLIEHSSVKNQPQFIHAFNYPSIKKRLLVMKKQTGKASALVRQLGVLIILSVAFFGFCAPADVIPDREGGKMNISNEEPKTPQRTDFENQDLKQDPKPNYGNNGPTPSEFIIEMKDKNALFYYNNKSISADQAVILIQRSRKIDLVARHTGLKNPIVNLSNAEMPEEYSEILLLIDP